MSATSPSMNGKPMPAPAVPRYRYPSERHLLPTRCAHCGARLVVSDRPTTDHPAADLDCLLCSRTACELIADGARGVLTADSPSPARGRPPGIRPVSDRNIYQPCPQCDVQPVRKGTACCRDCERRRRLMSGITTRLLLLLADGEPVHHSDLTQQLGCTYDALRAAVKRLLRDGYDVGTSGRDGRYRLRNEEPTL